MNLDTYHTIGKLQQAIGNITLEMELDEMLSLERSV
jgi:hypothetical protein